MAPREAAMAVLEGDDWAREEAPTVAHAAAVVGGAVAAAVHSEAVGAVASVVARAVAMAAHLEAIGVAAAWGTAARAAAARAAGGTLRCRAGGRCRPSPHDSRSRSTASVPGNRRR